MKISRCAFVKAAAAAGVALAAMGTATVAQARSDVFFSIGANIAPGVTLGVSNASYYPRSMYVQPAPVYYQPAPVYYQPQPVYYPPEPVYYQSEPTYYQPQTVYYTQPVVTYVRPPHWRHHRHRHHYYRY